MVEHSYNKDLKMLKNDCSNTSVICLIIFGIISTVLTSISIGIIFYYNVQLIECHILTFEVFYRNSARTSNECDVDSLYGVDFLVETNQKNEWAIHDVCLNIQDIAIDEGKSMNNTSPGCWSNNNKIWIEDDTKYNNIITLFVALLFSSLCLFSSSQMLLFSSFKFSKEEIRKKYNI